MWASGYVLDGYSTKPMADSRWNNCPLCGDGLQIKYSGETSRLDCLDCRCYQVSIYRGKIESDYIRLSYSDIEIAITRSYTRTTYITTWHNDYIDFKSYTVPGVLPLDEKKLLGLIMML